MPFFISISIDGKFILTSKAHTLRWACLSWLVSGRHIPVSRCPLHSCVPNGHLVSYQIQRCRCGRLLSSALGGRVGPKTILISAALWTHDGQPARATSTWPPESQPQAAPRFSEREADGARVSLFPVSSPPALDRARALTLQERPECGQGRGHLAVSGSLSSSFSCLEKFSVCFHDKSESKGPEL